MDQIVRRRKPPEQIISNWFGPPEEIGFTLPVHASLEAWAARIRSCWRPAVEAIIDTGRALIAAKRALPHGEWGEPIDRRLPFKARTAQMLMAIAADARISNPQHVALLPPAWGTLYELTRLSDEQFTARLADGTIRPDMERSEAVNGARAVMGSRIQPRNDLDYSPTPPWATRALTECVLPFMNVSVVNSTVHEPAAGEGHVGEVLREYFPTVCASDIHDYGRGDTIRDYLAENFKVATDWVVTNPPFLEKAEQFALKAIASARVGVAFFTRLQWLESVGRYERLFRDHPPTQRAFFCERVNLCMGRWDPDGTTATAYMWIVWLKGAPPRAPMWIPPGQREKLTQPGDREHFTTHPVKMREYHLVKPELMSPRQIGFDTPVGSIDHLEIPAFLRRDNRQCIVSSGGQP
jgi:hypothetical protein